MRFWIVCRGSVVGSSIACCLAAYAVLASGAPSRGADAAVFYVSPDGNDAWAGTSEQADAGKSTGPFRTPGRACDAVRQLKAEHGGKLDRRVTITLRGGNYFLSEPLVLTPADSGTGEFPVTFAARAGEKPVLSGGRLVTGWAKQAVDGRELWAAKVPERAPGGPTFRELWVDGKRAVRARHPDKGFLQVAELPDVTPQTAWTEGQTNFRYHNQDLAAWPDTPEAEVIVMSRWVESRLPVAGVDEKDRRVRFGKKSVWVLEVGDRYYAEGRLGFLNAPGEWHFDRKSSTLYYLPREGEDMSRAEVIVPALTQVVELEGDPQTGRWVEHLHFRGVGFSHSEWGWDSPGVQDARSGFAQAAIGVPAAVGGQGVRHCVFEKCEFSNAGNYGLELGGGSSDNRILRCTFMGLGAGGIKLGAQGLEQARQTPSARNEISDSRIHSCGNVFPSAVGIWVGQSSDNRIAYNEISDLYYTGISVGWTWGYGDAACGGNIVEHNHVHHIGGRSDEPEPILSDMGGIYTLGAQPGTMIRNNRFHDIQSIRYGGWGIYFDEGSTGIVAENNVIYRTTHAGFHQHYGRDNVLRNNILAFGKTRQIERSRAEAHRSFTFERNIVYWSEGEAIMGNWDNYNASFDRNVYWRTTGGEFPFAYLPLAQWREKGMDKGSVIADPRFVDPTKDDFNLRPDSPAPAVGFVPFDQSAVGPRREPAGNAPGTRR